MPTVSDYVVVADSTSTLEIGGDIDASYTFSVPSNIDTTKSAIATWRLEAENSPDNLAWNLAVNGTQVVSFTHGADRFAGLQEVFSGSVLQSGSNSATVTVTGGDGRIRFSDFVVHFQVTV